MIMSSSVSLEAMYFVDCLPMENWLLRDKVAWLCSVSDIGFSGLESYFFTFIKSNM